MKNHKLFSFMISTDGNEYQIDKEALSVYIKNLKEEIQAEERFLEISKQKIENNRNILKQMESMLKSII